MYQIQFNDYKSYDDFGLKVVSENLSRPVPRNVYQTINGMDGNINMTNIVHGRTTYEPRTLTVVFQSFEQSEKLYDELCLLIDNTLSGQTLKIIRDSDVEHYLFGEILFESEHNFYTQTHTLTATVNPYRLDTEKTSETFEVDIEQNVVLENAKMPVQPTFYTESTGMSVVFGTKEINILPNGFTTPEIFLLEGETSLTLKGNGTVAISYRQGAL